MKLGTILMISSASNIPSSQPSLTQHVLTAHVPGTLCWRGQATPSNGSGSRQKALKLKCVHTVVLGGKKSTYPYSGRCQSCWAVAADPALTLMASPGAPLPTHLPIGPGAVFKLWLGALASHCSRECAVSALLPCHQVCCGAALLFCLSLSNVVGLP